MGFIYTTQLCPLQIHPFDPPYRHVTSCGKSYGTGITLISFLGQVDKSEKNIKFYDLRE